jgi:hypothetical protein
MRGTPAQDVKPEPKSEKPAFTAEEIEQLVAPVALHPDDLLAQILMASTYPLEVVEAARWVKANPKQEGSALTKALEAKKWDASVKSLVQFPQVLEMMDQKLDWMQKLGNAFLAQQKEVMAAVQKLRKKAKDAGNLESGKEQTVKVEQETIIIQSSSPDTVYVPVYNPTVVYGGWPYPAYPPYYYHPPYYGGAAFGFVAGVAIGAAWGYAWGGCHWGHSEVDIDIDRNVNRNTEINRDRYKNDMAKRGTQGGKGSFQHDPSHRKGVSYGDRKTTERFNKGATSGAASREAFRGRTQAGASDLAGRGGSATRDARPSAGTRDTRSGGTGGTRPSTTPSRSSSSSNRSGLNGSGQGSSTRAASSRGNASRSASRSGGGMRGGGGGRGGGGRR